MSPQSRRFPALPTRGLPAAVALLLISTVTACDWLIGTDWPDEASVVIEGTTPDVIHVITSQNFVMGYSPDQMTTELQFLQSDTVHVTLPFQQRYDLRSNPWFAVRIMSPEGDTAQVTMRVLLDGSERFNQTTVLIDQYMQYFVTHR